MNADAVDFLPVQAGANGLNSSAPGARSASSAQDRAVHRHKREPVGSIRDDLVAVAAHLQRRILDRSAAWVDDRGDIYVARSDEAADIPITWLLGIYAIGVTIADLEADLRTMRRERRRDWAVD